MTRTAILAAATALVALSAGAIALSSTWQPHRARDGGSFQRGVALGLFAWEEDFDYGGLLDEIVATGATDVEIVVTWYQESLRTQVIEPREHFSPSMETVRRTLRQARERNLRVLLFPIVRLHHRAPGEWRGKIEYSDGWWGAYRAFIFAMAAAAQEGGVARLSVGSELLRLEKEHAHWSRLIKDVRSVYRGRLMYSANWDHFDKVPFWVELDDAGMTAYFELTKNKSPTLEELVAGWQRWVPSIRDFAERVGRPLVLTEVGYPSLDGANIHPWDETRRAPVDLEEQRLCYAAFIEALGRSSSVAGAYFWNWFGVGGRDDTDYTPRSKPAAEEMKRFFADPDLDGERGRREHPAE